MAWTSAATGAEFAAGVSHLANPGRANVGSITLGTDASEADQGLDQTSARWDSLTPHAVLQSATGGSPEDTDLTAEMGQQALGNHDDQAQAGQSWDRALMTRAADVGQDDGVS